MNLENVFLPKVNLLVKVKWCFTAHSNYVLHFVVQNTSFASSTTGLLVFMGFTAVYLVEWLGFIKPL